MVAMSGWLYRIFTAPIFENEEKERIAQEQTFTQEQLSRMEHLAALASSEIDNSRIYETTRKEIRQRGAVEVELLASEEWFRKVFHASPVAINTSSQPQMEQGLGLLWLREMSKIMVAGSGSRVKPEMDPLSSSHFLLDLNPDSVLSSFSHT